MNIHPSPLRDALAADYVLGHLHGAARRRFERLLPAHPVLQRAVVDWERRLNPLVIASPAVSPPPAVWNQIQRQLFPKSPRQSWWHSLALWRGLALAGVLAALIVAAPYRGLSPPAAEPAFAMIRGKQREVLWTVTLADSGKLHVSNPRPMAMPPDQRCLLWLKTGDAPPVMLGVLPDDGGMRVLPMPEGKTRPTQGELWVTMQPMEPSPPPPARPLYQTRWQAL
jgi:anti-sigma-K factor RskA